MGVVNHYGIGWEGLQNIEVDERVYTIWDWMGGFLNIGVDERVYKV